MRRRERKWRGDRRTQVTQAARSPTPRDAATESLPPTEPGAPRSGALRQPLEDEEQFGLPQGVRQFFRIEAASGRSFAGWAGTEEMAQAAADRIDRMTVVTGRKTFRIAAVPVRREDGSADHRSIAKVREIKS